MKSSPPSWVVKALIVALALGGWAMWAKNRHTAVQMNQTAKELEELNEYLLQDIGQFKHKYERIVRAGAFSGRGVSDFRLRQAIAALREENGTLKKKLDEVSESYEREIEALQAAKEKEAAAPGGSAVDLGTLSVSPQGAAFQDATGAKPAPAAAPSPAPSASAPGPGVKAKVLTVDEKEEFVIVDVGVRTGAQEGARYTVFRGAAEIARVEVIEAREKLSACIIEYAGAVKRLQPNEEISLVRDL